MGSLKENEKSGLSQDSDRFESLNHSLTSIILASNYRLCKDIMKIVNEYLSKHNSFDIQNEDITTIKSESDNLVKSLLGRILQNAQTGGCSFDISNIPNEKISDISKASLIPCQEDISDEERPASLQRLKTVIKKPEKKIEIKLQFHKNSISLGDPVKKVAKKDFWTPEEDAQLLDLLQQRGKKWTQIGKIIGGRSGKQVRDRYLNKLRPDIKEEDWTEEEDNKFLDLYKKYGNKWCQIACFLPGRTENQVKNRFYTKIIKKTDTKLESQESLDVKDEFGTKEEDNSFSEALKCEEKQEDVSDSIKSEYKDLNDLACKLENE